MIDAPPLSPDRLDSWKAIADYLRRDVATVRRWEKSSGLPIRRVPGGTGRSVFAYTAEIDAWLNAGGSAQSPQLDAPSPAAESQTPNGAGAPHTRRGPAWWRVGVAVTAFATLAVAGTWRLRAVHISPANLRVEVTPEGAVARDGSGTELWRRRFSPEYITAFSGYGKRSEVVAGSNPSVFIATADRIRRSDGLVESGELLQLTPAGVVQQRFQFDDRATFDRREFGPPWGITTFAVDDRAGTRRIAVAAHHYEWSASMVTILDERFHRLGTYWQWGWIEEVHWLAPDRLLIAGFNDARDGGMVALLDPSTLDGQSPEQPGAHGYCQTCGTPTPLRMVIMPRTELNRVTGSRFNRAVIERLPDRMVVRTIEVLPEGSAAVDVLYEFSPELELLRASFSGPYWDLHKALHEQGKIAHGADHCPDRKGPPEIQVWEPRSGWKTIAIR